MLHLKVFPRWLQLLAVMVAAWHVNTHAASLCVGFKGILWEKGGGRAKDRREKNFKTSSFLKISVYSEFKCARTHETAKLCVRDGMKLACIRNASLLF